MENHAYEITLWLVSSIGGGTLAILGCINLYLNWRYKVKEYRWQRFLKAESIIDLIYNDKFTHNALRMTGNSLTKIELLDEYKTSNKTHMKIEKKI
ncbi:MAG: hypothetical protein U5L09_10455 [Bacteroidales bacterium]|nr:hypothetical protein [Bacteroidales bacterium]